MRRALLENWHLKGLSLLIAIGLFVLVRGDKDAAIEGYVKVEYLVPKDRVLVSDPPAELRLTVRGPWIRISRFDERDLPPVRLDLSATHSGDIRFTDEMVKLPFGLRLASIVPATAQLQFEPRMTRRVPIQAIVDGDPANGYRVLRSTAHPKDVRITGAKSVIEGIQRMPTRPIPLADARTSLHARVQLEPPPPHAEFEGSDELTIEIDVEAILSERLLRAIPVQTTTRWDGLIQPAQVDVLLKGPIEALGKMVPSALSLAVEAPVENAHGPMRKQIAVGGLLPGLTAELRPNSVTLVPHRRR